MFLWMFGVLCAFATPPKENSNKWFTWKPHRHPFVVSFPAKPTVDKKYQTTSFGDLEVLTGSYTDSGWGYIASFVYYPSNALWSDDPDSFLQVTAKGIVGNLQAAFPANNYFPISRGTFKGVSFLFQVREKNEVSNYYVQLYLIDNALVQLMVYNRSSHQKDVDESQFFSSFQHKSRIK